MDRPGCAVVQREHIPLARPSHDGRPRGLPLCLSRGAGPPDIALKTGAALQVMRSEAAIRLYPGDTAQPQTAPQACTPLNPPWKQ
ncbi:hypothetical protein AAFF_G00144330 [Aldrovandia affinis]|uniref:Uncharacterized protein n=1 Tax=Aldrovandia affinis TaxID=143900 RepID=A0AAD7WWI1_9TELE|nr:hypothetical protein AAFF_G00144330 [Aldrovandia affinis]